MIESQSKRRERPLSKVTSTITSISQSVDPTQTMEVDSTEDSESLLPKSLTSSDLLPSETEFNEYGKSGFTLKSSRRLAMSSRALKRNFQKPVSAFNIYDPIELTCEDFQRNYHTSGESSKLFVSL
ncbi:hypothetical protein O181_034726 [Austropuccinia psidii MF-1]|uniref:Uncharacterized protein n=1 Tax=Austropuccinia psidii MF-1 TaxID=1389203 RepID=A0A9Q3H8B0_9BASI|nr:hypothetical protein [Austropuccinia psidii MF-1]